MCKFVYVFCPACTVGLKRERVPCFPKRLHGKPASGECGYEKVEHKKESVPCAACFAQICNPQSPEVLPPQTPPRIMMRRYPATPSAQLTNTFAVPETPETPESEGDDVMDEDRDEAEDHEVKNGGVDQTREVSPTTPPKKNDQRLPATPGNQLRVSFWIPPQLEAPEESEQPDENSQATGYSSEFNLTDMNDLGRTLRVPRRMVRGRLPVMET